MEKDRSLISPRDDDRASHALEYDAAASAPQLDTAAAAPEVYYPEETPQYIDKDEPKMLDLRQPSSLEDQQADRRPSVIEKWKKTRTGTKIALSAVLILLILVVVIVPSVVVTTRDQNNSSTDDSTTQPPTPVSSSPIAASSTVPPPPIPSADGIWLVNYENGTVRSSGMAYHSSPRDVLEGRSFPSELAVVDDRRWTVWEGSRHTGTFPLTGTVFNVTIEDSDGIEPPINARVGNGTNGYHPFTVYRDDGRLLYTAAGIDYYTFYYCFG